MSTAAQIAANQANAKLSTGPRTLEGKASVSQSQWSDQPPIRSCAGYAAN
jgi:hypothetical protein